ncbi:hypothetical protein [Streptomyces bottropensis]|jgi:hypothetical protein
MQRPGSLEGARFDVERSSGLAAAYCGGADTTVIVQMAGLMGLPDM